jgi:hypothetical protein
MQRKGSNVKMDLEITAKFICPCCGNRTLGEEGSYDICPVCFWEDDKAMYRDPDLADGANKVSLNEARENYKKYGACMEEFLPFVREPFAEEIVNE